MDLPPTSAPHSAALPSSQPLAVSVATSAAPLASPSAPSRLRAPSLPHQSPATSHPSAFLYEGDFSALRADDDPEDSVPSTLERALPARTPLRIALGASTPSTPAAAPFNPDDFFASPLNNASATRPKRTPECKRRLFLSTGDIPVTTPRSHLSAHNAITPLRQVLAVGSTTSPQSSTFLTFGNLETPRAATASAPPPSTGKKRGRASIRDSMRVAAESSLPGFSIAPSGSPTISSFLSPHRSVLPTTNLLLPSPSPNSPRAKLFQSPHLQLHDRKIPNHPLFMTPITPVEEPPVTKCSCKASRCLKLYCPCFASSGMCAEGCSCKNCQNTKETHDVIQEARKTVLSRDPKAFDPKVKSTASASNNMDIHTKGCNCRKGCAKNYCVCRELRVSCGPRCTCSGPTGCLNGKECSGDHENNADSENVATIGLAPARFSNSLPGQKSPTRKRASSTKKVAIRLLAKVQNGAAASSSAKQEDKLHLNANGDDPSAEMQIDMGARPLGMSPAPSELTAALFTSHKTSIGFGSLPSLRNGDASGFSTPNSTRRLQLESNPKRLDFDAEVEALTGDRNLRNPQFVDFSQLAGSINKEDGQHKYQLPGDGKLLPSLVKSPLRGSPGMSRLEDLFAGQKRQNSVPIDSYRMSEEDSKLVNSMSAVNFDSDRDKFSTPDTEFVRSLRNSRDAVGASLFPNTPDRIRASSFSFTTSPATEKRLSRSPRTRFMRSARGRPESSARPPRILRVKMGSGRALRKFAIGSE